MYPAEVSITLSSGRGTNGQGRVEVQRHIHKARRYCTQILPSLGSPQKEGASFIWREEQSPESRLEAQVSQQGAE